MAGMEVMREWREGLKVVERLVLVLASTTRMSIVRYVVPI